MKNRQIRNQIETTSTGKIIIKQDYSVKWVNENIHAIKIISRFNKIAEAVRNREKSKTHEAKVIYNNIGNYAGFYWIKK